MPSNPDNPKPDHAYKFNEVARAEYIEHLRNGNLKYESARLVGVAYETVVRRRNADEDFKAAEQHAMAEAREGIERVLFNMASQGDIAAIKMWLHAHDKSTYADRKTVEIDATPNAVALSQADALAKVAELQNTLEKRRLVLEEADGPQQIVLEVESEEIL